MKTSTLFSSENFHTSSSSSKDKLYVRRLEQRLNKLYLIVEALWLLLKEKYNIDDEKLNELIVAIDMKDGRRDGKVAANGPQTCPQCGRANSRNYLYCIYCGAFIDTNPFE